MSEDNLEQEEVIEEDENLEIAPDTDGGEPTEEPEYTPNFDYKYKDEDRQFHERLRESVRSKEDEDYIRDLYTRADGLESYKSKNAELETNSSALVNAFQTLKNFKETGDARGLQSALGLSDDFWLDHSESLLKEGELPEEQQQIIRENREMANRLAQMEGRIQSFETSGADARIESDMSQLQNLISSEQNIGVAKAMRSVGLDMANEVLKEGHMEYLQTNVEPSVASVVAKIAKTYSHLTNNSAANKPTLPNLRGVNQTPVKPKVSSLDDLRKLANSIPQN